jgi:hypothetical protein
MTQLKLWGQPKSINVQKVLWALEELGLPYERIDAGGQFGRVKEADYLSLNPNGLVPTLEVDGAPLWESNAHKYSMPRASSKRICKNNRSWPANTSRGATSRLALRRIAFSSCSSIGRH